jgi:hypothetical protein
MARLTRKQQDELVAVQRALTQLQMALGEDRLVLAVKSSGTTILEYQNPHTGDHICPVNKKAHELTAYTNNAQRFLARFLETWA